MKFNLFAVLIARNLKNEIDYTILIGLLTRVTVLHGFGHLGQDAVSDVRPNSATGHADIQISGCGLEQIQLDPGE